MNTKEREQLRDDIARRVMGWTLRRNSWAYSETASVWHTQEGMPVMTRYAWCPDESDAQAMKVLDRMTAIGFDHTLGISGGTEFTIFEREGEEAVRVEDGDRRLVLLRAALGAIDRWTASPAGGEDQL